MPESARTVCTSSMATRAPRPGSPRTLPPTTSCFAGSRRSPTAGCSARTACSPASTLEWTTVGWRSTRGTLRLRWTKTRPKRVGWERAPSSSVVPSGLRSSRCLGSGSRAGLSSATANWRKACAASTRRQQWRSPVRRASCTAWLGPVATSSRPASGSAITNVQRSGVHAWASFVVSTTSFCSTRAERTTRACSVGRVAGRRRRVSSRRPSTDSRRRALQWSATRSRGWASSVDGRAGLGKRRSYSHAARRTPSRCSDAAPSPLTATSLRRQQSWLIAISAGSPSGPGSSEASGSSWQSGRSRVKESTNAPLVL